MGHLTLGIVLQADMSHTERLSEMNTPFQNSVSEYLWFTNKNSKLINERN